MDEWIAHDIIRTTNFEPPTHPVYFLTTLNTQHFSLRTFTFLDTCMLFKTKTSKRTHTTKQTNQVHSTMCTVRLYIESCDLLYRSMYISCSITTYYTTHTNQTMNECSGIVLWAAWLNFIFRFRGIGFTNLLLYCTSSMVYGKRWSVVWWNLK